MSKVLYIKANIKPVGESRTFQVSDYFVEQYQKEHPEDEIITLDLYKEEIDFLRPEDLGKIYGAKDESSKHNPVLKYAYQFAEADKYIFAAPMWNLGAPAIIKAYFDYVSVAGITFKYAESGPVGLCGGKKAVHITSRGGVYAGTAIEMDDRYLRTILGLFGIKEVTTIPVEGVDILGIDVAAKVNEAKEVAQKLVAEF